VFHSVARLVRHGLSDVFDQIETGTSTLSDALSLVCTAILVGAGFVFLRRAWRSLAILRSGRLLSVPRLGRRVKLLAVLTFGGTIALVCQYGDLTWISGRLFDLPWLAVRAAYANRDALWQALLAINESTETIEQVAKGTVGALATYVTLKFAGLRLTLRCQSSALYCRFYCRSFDMAMTATSMLVSGCHMSSLHPAKSIGCMASGVWLPGRS
jgi:hypothetical protein